MNFQLLFENEYMNGKRNRKGKEYSNSGKLIYEEEYKNGKRNGKGKLYNYFNGKLLFKGDFLYGYKVKGKGFIKGIIEYEVEYNYERKWNGKGYDTNHNIYMS